MDTLIKSKPCAIFFSAHTVFTIGVNVTLRFSIQTFYDRRATDLLASTFYELRAVDLLALHPIFYERRSIDKTICWPIVDKWRWLDVIFLIGPTFYCQRLVPRLSFKYCVWPTLVQHDLWILAIKKLDPLALIYCLL